MTKWQEDGTEVKSPEVLVDEISPVFVSNRSEVTDQEHQERVQEGKAVMQTEENSVKIKIIFFLWKI